MTCSYIYITTGGRRKKEMKEMFRSKVFEMYCETLLGFLAAKNMIYKRRIELLTV